MKDFATRKRSAGEAELDGLDHDFVAAVRAASPQPPPRNTSLTPPPPARNPKTPKALSPKTFRSSPKQGGSSPRQGGTSPKSGGNSPKSGVSPKSGTSPKTGTSPKGFGTYPNPSAIGVKPLVQARSSSGRSITVSKKHALPDALPPKKARTKSTDNLMLPQKSQISPKIHASPPPFEYAHSSVQLDANDEVASEVSRPTYTSSSLPTVVPTAQQPIAHLVPKLLLATSQMTAPQPLTLGQLESAIIAPSTKKDDKIPFSYDLSTIAPARAEGGAVPGLDDAAAAFWFVAAKKADFGANDDAAPPAGGSIGEHVNVLKHLNLLNNPAQFASHPVNATYGFVERGLKGGFELDNVAMGDAGVDSVVGTIEGGGNRLSSSAARVAVNIMTDNTTVTYTRGADKFVMDALPEGITQEYIAGSVTNPSIVTDVFMAEREEEKKKRHLEASRKRIKLMKSLCKTMSRGAVMKALVKEALASPADEYDILGLSADPIYLAAFTGNGLNMGADVAMLRGKGLQGLNRGSSNR